MLIEDENLYQVGGVVRDEILGLKSIDFDYTYVGDAIEFAQKSGFNILKINPDFHTVRVMIGNEEIDIASTRLESYPKKGHLPRIDEIGVPIEEDLKRRDFSINAIAKRTTDGKIIDVFNGLDDIKSKKLKVLHDDSFIDDPTRIIRGLKFFVRFNFDLDDRTKLLQEKYLNNVNYDMSYHRLKNELKDAFSLNRGEVFNMFKENKMYNLLNKNINIPNIDGKVIENQLKNMDSQYLWLIYLSFFDISRLNLTKIENKILEYALKLYNGEKPDKSTPSESLLISKLKSSI